MSQTFIFDFDQTISVIPAIQHAFFASVNYKVEKMEAISQIIKNAQARYGNVAILDKIIAEISLEIGRNLHISDYHRAAEEILKSGLTDGIAEVMGKIDKSGAQILVIGGGGTTCAILSEVLVNIGISPQNVYSGRTLLDKNGDILLGEVGFVNCFNGERISQTWSKAEAVNNLRKIGKISGRVIMIGDGENDLEVKTSGNCDIFIGFGLHKFNLSVKNGCDKYAESPDEFFEIIDKYL